MTTRIVPNGPLNARQRGFTLIELMIALLLGLIVIAAASSVFISNRRAFAATETMGRVQETGRVAFELMARDVREAAGNACSRKVPVANTLNNSASTWWTNYSSGIQGFDEGALSGSSSGTDALQLMMGTTDGRQMVSYLKGNNTSSSELEINDVSGLSDGDIVMICDFSHAAIFQITAVQASALKIQHNPGGSESPGNCTKVFNYPVDCSKVADPSKEPVFKNGATLARFTGVQWYIRDSSADSHGKALYRAVTRNSGGVVSVVPEQIAEGVEGMELKYLESGKTAYVDAGSVTDWGNVIAVYIELTLQAREGTEAGKNIQGTDGVALSRKLTHTVTLRNRLS